MFCSKSETADKISKYRECCRQAHGGKLRNKKREKKSVGKRKRKRNEMGNEKVEEVREGRRKRILLKTEKTIKKKRESKQWRKGKNIIQKNIKLKK